MKRNIAFFDAVMASVDEDDEWYWQTEINKLSKKYADKNT